MRRVQLLILILFAACRTSVAQTEFCNARNTAFEEGESLYYKVWYNMGRMWIGAGEATLTVNTEQLNNKKTYHVVGAGNTLKSYEWFYKVRDKYETWIEASSMQPLKFLRNVNEGGFKIYNSVSFNHTLGQALSTNGVYKVPKCVQDVVSAIYYARNIDFSDLKPGAKIPFSMFLDDKVYNLYIRYLGKEKIETRYGTFNTIKIAPLLIDGSIFKGGEKMAIWVTDDANHIPVRIDSPILVGSVKVDLMGFQKLRNPATALLSKKKGG